MRRKITRDDAPEDALRSVAFEQYDRMRAVEQYDGYLKQRVIPPLLLHDLLQRHAEYIMASVNVDGRLKCPFPFGLGRRLLPSRFSFSSFFFFFCSSLPCLLGFREEILDNGEGMLEPVPDGAW